MRRIVLDPSAFAAWFGSDRRGRALRAEYEGGTLTVIAPPSFPLDVMAAAARSGWPPDRLARLSDQLDRVGFELRDPPAAELAAWLVKGLNGSHAACAALASGLGLPLVTGDADLLRIAATVAQSLDSA